MDNKDKLPDSFFDELKKVGEEIVGESRGVIFHLDKSALESIKDSVKWRHEKELAIVQLGIDYANCTEESKQSEVIAVPIEKTYSLLGIAEMCVDFDKVHGEYPDEKWAGYYLFQHFFGIAMNDCNAEIPKGLMEKYFKYADE